MAHEIFQYIGIAATAGFFGSGLAWGSAIAVSTFGLAVAVPIAAISALAICVGATEYVSSPKQ